MPQPRIDVWGCAFFCLRSCFSGFRFRPREDDNNANAVGLKKSCVRSLKKSCVEITSYHPIFRTQKEEKRSIDDETIDHGFGADRSAGNAGVVPDPRDASRSAAIV
jgi:hypothetical protein